MSLVKYNNNSISSLTTAGQLASGSLVPISEQTASGSASIEFTTGIDSTYPIYKFEFINCHPSTDNVQFTFNLSTDGGSNYNVTKTNTFFTAYHDESDTDTNLGYVSAHDIAQSTGESELTYNLGNDNDQSISGSLHLFNPSSTTFVKHYISNVNTAHNANYTRNDYTGGYGNIISAINAIRFKMSSGTFDGTIKLYGIKDS